MSGYIGTQPVPQATQHREAFTATASQTSFATAGYTPQFIDVYLNGVKLAAADYTATNGSDIVLTVGAALGDILEYVAYTPFGVASQTFTGTTTTEALTVTGAFTSKGIDDNATATAMTLDASGNVGIGTSSPTAFGGGFIVSQTTGSSGGYSLQSSGSVVTQVAADSTASVGYTGTRSNHPHVFTTNNTERLRLDASGNLLVGKTSDSFSTVGSSYRANGSISATASSNEVLDLNRLGTDGGIMRFFKDGSTVGSIQADAGYLNIGSGATRLDFVDASPKRIIPRAGPSSASDGVIDLGDSGSRFKDLYLSGGVYLGGTTSANLLDDYEEGTCTPGITGWTGTYGKQDGVYTKIGNWVHCYGVVKTNGGTGSFSSDFPGLAGLPFTGGISISGAMGYAHIISGSTGIPSSKTSLLPLDGPGSGSSSAFPNWVGVGGDSGNFTKGYLNASSNVEYRFMISYRTS